MSKNNMSMRTMFKHKRESNTRKNFHWHILIFSTAVWAGVFILSQILSGTNNFVLEYTPEEGVVVARSSMHVQLEPVKPPAVLRLLAEPLIAFAFVVGTADIACTAFITALLLAFIMVAQSLYRGQSIGDILRALIASIILSAQVFTVACWLSFYAPTMRYKAVKRGCAIANLHAHTYYSSGLFSPAAVVEWHRRRGFKVLAVTDTNTIRGGIEAQLYAMEKGYEMIVIAGKELRSKTHLLLLGINRNYNPEKEPDQVAKEVRSAGGVAIVAHVWTAHHPVDELALYVDGFEVINRNIISDNVPLWQAFYNTFALISSNDFKFGAHSFTATCLHGEIQDVKSALEALRSGKTLPMTWLTHLPISPYEYELQSWVDKLRTVAAALLLYLAFFDIWAALGWAIATVIGFVVIQMVIGTRRTYARMHRTAQMRANILVGCLNLIMMVAGIACVLFGTLWTWSPTLKMALGYHPYLVILTWLIGDLLFFWRRRQAIRKQAWVISKI
ncbi:MAG: hypothetical protein RMK18_03105 [Armatimonadota bacterium]|nr:hypothetical protein [Armatimonadota bacterium]MDW8024838.1 hypothetical protein [Armatimonadota bacterium]